MTINLIAVDAFPIYSAEERYELNSSLLIIEQAADKLVIISHKNKFLSNNPDNNQLITKIKESPRSISQLQKEFSGFENEGSLISSVKELLRAGIIVRSVDSPKEIKKYWLELGVSPLYFGNKVKETVVFVDSMSTSSEFVVSRLNRLGIITSNELTQAKVCIAILNNYEELVPIVKKYKRNVIPIVVARGKLSWGPVFETHGPCILCLINSLKRNRCESYSDYNAASSIVENSVQDELIHYPALTLATEEIARWLVSSSLAPIGNRIRSFSFSSNKLTSISINNVCGCNYKKDINVQIHLNFQAENQNHIRKIANGKRVRNPKDSLRHLNTFVSRETGQIVNLTKFFPSGCQWTNVYRASYYVNGESEIQHAWGKGLNKLQSKVSALAEAIERMSCSFSPSDAYVTSCYQELKNRNKNIVAPNDVMGFSDNQFKADQSNQTSFGPNIPRKFKDTFPLRWIQTNCLIDNCEFYIPIELVYFRCGDSSGLCTTDSNGVAAGNTIEEAFVHAFLELVERDAFAIWWYNCISRPTLVVKGKCKHIDALLWRHEQCGNTVTFFDISNDLKIPVVAAVLEVGGSQHSWYEVTAGAHFNPRVAILRALTELGQKYEIGYLKRRQHPLAYKETKLRDEHPWIFDDMDLVSSVNLENLCTQSFDLKKSVKEIIVDIVKTNLDNSRIFAIDLTKMSTRFPVVRVIVPGLSPHWPRFGIERLYKIPKLMGWLNEEFLESEFNLPPGFSSPN